MNVTEIPFVKLLGIEQNGTKLSLPYRADMLNHIGTLHASAQFALAETQSGLFLKELFRELEGSVVPVLRDADIKYKKPAKEKIIAYADVSNESVEKFKELFSKKGRGVVTIDVELKDVDDTLTCKASFSWFIQKI